jgi:hypothetical protein
MAAQSCEVFFFVTLGAFVLLAHPFFQLLWLVLGKLELCKLQNLYIDPSTPSSSPCLN